MFQHTSNNTHHSLHIAESIKKAAKWYFDHAAANYVWSAKPMENNHK